MSPITAGATAMDRLQRLLAAIPLFADDETLSLEQLEQRLGGESTSLLRDLQTLPDRYDAPGGFIDPIQVAIESSRVSVRSSHFLRPTRINVPELCALEIGLAMLAAQTPPDERSGIERARTRIRQAIVSMPGGDRDAMDAAAPQHGDPSAVQTIRQAIADRRKVRLAYRGGRDVEANARVIRPYALSPDRGTWFLIAHCERSDGLRLFRLDRVESVEALGETFAIPEGIDVDALLDARRPIVAGRSHPTMTVRYSPAIARWIAEREEKPLDADGSITVEHPLADAAWGIRHALQYGRDAEVLSPPEVREALRQTLALMAADET